MVLSTVINPLRQQVVDEHAHPRASGSERAALLHVLPGKCHMTLERDLEQEQMVNLGDELREHGVSFPSGFRHGTTAS